MIIYKNSLGYSNKKKYIVGKGFVDSLSSIFSSLRSSAMPLLRNAGSYVSTNKDLIAKPLLGAVGNLAAVALTEGGTSIINKIRNRKPDAIPSLDNAVPQPAITLDAKRKELLKKLLSSEASPPQSVSNIMGSGVKKKKGSGVKRF